mmetsp:Transcript_60649/g.170916  ORF Transcript_60649/g.170916 Transcript_60649/m.170916 type:complete len:302 (+) Transcript_60649:836-1741(+)
MNAWMWCLWSSRLKNLCAEGTDPRAPWMVALGSMERKQKAVSGHTASQFARRHPSQVHGRMGSVATTAKKTPRKRMHKPATMMGSTSKKMTNTPGCVLLPSMLKSMSCPKTQMPPIVDSTSCRSSASATAAKNAPVTITSSSDWKRDPELKPIGISASPPSSTPMAKAMRATEMIMSSASTVAPVKIRCPVMETTAMRLGMIHPLAAPRRAPTEIVATIRTMLATTSSFTSTESWWAGSERPARMPKPVSAAEASKGAHMKTRRGSGFPGNWIPNSFILGITSPSPTQNSVVPRTMPSTQV